MGMRMSILRRACCTASAAALAAAIVVCMPATATSASPLGGYASGTYTTIDYPGAVQTDISGINNLGTMVGYYVDAAGVDHGFIYQRGTFTPFNDPSAGTGADQGTQGSGINDFGTIVGAYIDGSGNYNGFIERGGSFTTLDGPNPAHGSFNYANFVNDLGTVTGMYSDTSNTSHGFLYRNGTYTTVNDPLGARGRLKAQCSLALITSGCSPGYITTATGLTTPSLAVSRTYADGVMQTCKSLR